MKVKFSWMYLVALVAAFTWTSCQPDDDPAPAVGITEIKVTPQGSAVSYTAAITGFDALVGIPANVFSEESLDSATIAVTATMNTEVYCNGELVGAGAVVDLTQPVVLTAKGAGIENIYTLTAQPSEVAYGDMSLKASSFIGFPAGLIDYDVTAFNGKFYAITTSVSGEGTEEDPVIEHYQLYSSEDGANWSEVKYNASTEGVTLPEGQDSYVIGGEGARLAVHNGRMFVLGGARTKGADIYGNPAEVEDWGFMVMTNINAWRSFSTADGVNFECDTVATTYTYTDYEGAEVVIPTSEADYDLGAAHVNVVSFGGKLFMQGGFYPSFGMWQGARRYESSTDGKNWEAVSVASTSEEYTADVNMRMGNALFVFNNKMWCLGGYKNFLSASMMQNNVWSSEDGVNWTLVADSVKGFKNICDMKVLATDEAVYLFGGIVCETEGSTLSNKIYRSTDCINWEEVETPEAFTARRHIAAVAQDGSAWLFGGVSTPSGDTYGYPVIDTDEFATDTWVKPMK